ncbi:hypothetical protein SAMN05444392_103187 [Seinonella peptonophila]|uniref:Uncharacterized protein n=1 Tax=Seinonella peptonophila TaxID=112248 RepID=A0A1M4WEI8_9BACL|nr:hypothetical protein [Seinonella peptonophila]SHE79701.1 hypothetical protein SAMN05444392_103187 [Seinonella peptonophila]
MNNLKKVVSTLALTTALSFPLSAFAQDIKVPVEKSITAVQSHANLNYQLQANTKIKGTNVEVSIQLKGGSALASHLINTKNWEIVDQHGSVLPAIKSVHVKNKTMVILIAKVENLKPSIQYCFNIRLKGKLEESLAKAKIKLTGQKGLVCATTGKPTPDQNNPKPDTPKNPDQDNPKQPTPKDPKGNDQPKQPNDKNDQPKNPKEDQKTDTPSDKNPKKKESDTSAESKTGNGWLDWLLSIF